MRTTTINDGRTVMATRDRSGGRNRIVPLCYHDRQFAESMAASMAASNAPCRIIEVNGYFYLEVVTD